MKLAINPLNKKAGTEPDELDKVVSGDPAEPEDSLPGANTIIVDDPDALETSLLVGGITDAPLGEDIIAGGESNDRIFGDNLVIEAI